ncbi:MAG: efflux RND transporter permease subunit [Planctomycetes bacterium]|nr:efflux RND transporter permease subunit [Planctomycetota bacterium]
MNAADDRYRGFYDALVRRPVALLVIFVALSVIGVISYVRIPVQMMPDGLVEPGLQIFVVNPGASAQENEEKVVRILEEQIRTLPGIEEIQSTANDDSAWSYVQFDANTDMELAKAELRDRIERARPQLPSSVQEVGVYSWSNENMPIVFFAILHPGDNPRTDFLIDTVVQRKLEGVDGVGKLEIWGVLDDSMRILLDEDKVRAANLDLGGLIRRLSADNFALPLGEVEDGERRVLLRSDMRFDSPEEIERFPIGNGLVIGDIGRVAPVKSVRNRLFKIDGQYAFYGEIQKDSQANVVETCARLRSALEELEADPRLAGEFRFLPLFDQGQFITASLAQLRDAAVWGGGLAVVVLFLFLRRVRSTLAVALSIPFSALVAIAWMQLGGGSFNVLTMTGITLAMGMLVDNSVVVIENIARLRVEGRSDLDAAAQGTREVALAVLLSTATTIVVFLPMIFMNENPMLRIMFGELGLPLCLSLAISLLAALVFLPVIAARVVVERHPSIERIAARLEPLAAAPARATAWVLGGLKLLAFAKARALFPAVRAAALGVTKVRWPLALVVLGWSAWSLQRAWPSIALARRLRSDFAWSPGMALDTALDLGLEVLAAPLALSILLLLLPWFARRGSAAPVRPASFVAEHRTLVEYIVDANTALLRWTLRHRFAATCASGLVFLSQIWPQTHMQVAAFGEDENTSRLSVMVELEDNFTLAQAEGEMRFYEAFFEARRERYGFEHLANRFDPRSGRLTLYWEENLTRADYDGIERDIRENLRAQPGHRVRLSGDESGANERNKNVVTFRLVGPNSEELAAIGAKAVEVLERIPGLSSVALPENSAQSQVRVVFDSDVAQGFGISPDSALQNIAWALRGWQLPRYQEEAREIPLIIEYDEANVAGLDTLRDLDIFNGQSAVPLSSFAQFQFARGSHSIYRRNGQTTYTIQARVDDPLRQKELSDAGYAALKSLELPRGVSVGEDDLVSTRQAEELRELQAAALLGGVLVFVLMCILFESLILPWSVLPTVPFAFVGAYWTLYITGTTMDSVGWIGLIILTGVVVNNGIVLVDCIQRLRDEGLERGEAVLRGVALRVRPVLMTAMTTVVGLIPTAIAEPASEGIDYRALATCIAGGLTLSTVLTLWVVPLFYTLFDDVARTLVVRARDLIGVWLARRARGVRAH